jgi:hypothetical protein
MAGATHRRWLHELPKTARPVGPRINRTFRSTLSPPPSDPDAQEAHPGIDCCTIR